MAKLRPMTNAEIAGRMGISERRVEVIYASALKKLHRRLCAELDLPICHGRVTIARLNELAAAQTAAQGARGAASCRVAPLQQKAG